MATKPRKKLEGNGMWESSRMMLPEHIVQINQWATEIKKRERIELDAGMGRRFACRRAIDATAAAGQARRKKAA